MSESAMLASSDRSEGELAFWVFGASAFGTVVPNAVLAAVAGAAMMVIWALDLTRGPGTGVYIAACVCGAVTYWAMLHGAVRALRRLVEVPWAVWPALLAWPVIWIGVAVLADPRGVLEPAPALLGAAGVLLAWFTSGRSHHLRGVRDHA